MDGGDEGTNEAIMPSALRKRKSSKDRGHGKDTGMLGDLNLEGCRERVVRQRKGQVREVGAQRPLSGV